MNTSEDFRSSLRDFYLQFTINKYLWSIPGGGFDDLKPYA